MSEMMRFVDPATPTSVFEALSLGTQIDSSLTDENAQCKKLELDSRERKLAELLAKTRAGIRHTEVHMYASVVAARSPFADEIRKAVGPAKSQDSLRTNARKYINTAKACIKEARDLAQAQEEDEPDWVADMQLRVDALDAGTPGVTTAAAADDAAGPSAALRTDARAAPEAKPAAPKKADSKGKQSIAGFFTPPPSAKRPVDPAAAPGSDEAKAAERNKPFGDDLMKQDD